MRFLERYAAIAAAVVMAVLMLQVHTVQAASEERIENIDVSVRAGSLPPAVGKRMEDSIRVIASQLMDGKTVKIAEKSKEHDASLIHEVFDKLLVGYTVEDVNVVPGRTALIQVSLIPWDYTIQRTVVSVDVEGMPDEVRTMVLHDAKGLETVFDSVMTGLPTAATDWTNGVLKHNVDSFMNEHLPEFRADFEVEPDEITKVHVVLYPRLPVVRTTDLSMRSDTVPNIFLVSHRKLMEERTHLFLGVPSAFVERHRQEIERMLEETLDARREFMAAGIHTKASIEPGEDMTIMLRSDTEKYRWRIEGYADISRDGSGDHDTRVRMYAGVMLSSRDMLYARLDFYPQAVDWKFAAGYERRLRKWLFADFVFDAEYGKAELGMRAILSPFWQLRYEYRYADHMGEGALRYKLHDFLSLEYAADPDGRWLRVIGDF